MPRKTTKTKCVYRESTLSKKRWSKLNRDALLGVDYCLRLLSTSTRMQKPQMEIIEEIHAELWDHINKRFVGDDE